MKNWKFWLGVLISAILLYFALRGLKFAEMWDVIKSAQYLWLIPGVAVYFIAVWVRAWRWHYLLRPLKKIPTRTMFPVVAIGYFGNNILPARAGEVLRAYILRKREGVPVSASLATVIVERIFDGVVMLGFVFINLPELAKLTGDAGLIGGINIHDLAIIGVVVFVGALLVFLLAAMFPWVTEKIVRWFIGRFVPERLREKTLGLSLRFLSGLEALRAPQEALMIFLTTVLIWLLETGKYWIVMHAFPFQVSFFSLMLMNGIVNLATTLPSAPGYVGTFDGPGIAVLMAYGISQEIAAGYTLVLHIALWLPITILGGFYFLREGLKVGQKFEVETEAHKSMKIAIVGAGIGGMAAAYDLANAGHTVTIFESAGYVGGLAAGFKEPHWKSSVENFYHHWFLSDQDMFGFQRELGLYQNVREYRPKTVAYTGGKFYPLDSPLAALTFPGFTFIDMVRFGLATVFLRYLAAWQPLEKVTADAWIRKYYGERNYHSLFEPLLQGKFGSHYQEVNMAWFWARIKTRSTKLLTYQGGFQAFSDDVAAQLQKRGIKIRLNTPILQIAPCPAGGLTIKLDSGDEVFERCLVTVSPGLLARLAPALPQGYLQGLLNLKNMGAVVMVLSMKEKLSEEGYYWFNLPKSAGYPFLALVEHTNLVPPAEFGGDHIVYVGDYLDNDHEYFRLSQAELLQRFLPAIAKFNPNFSADWVIKSWLFKTPYAQPIPQINHSQNIPAIQTPIPGLYFASMSQVYPWDRGTNFAVQIGRKAARLILNS